MARERMTGVDLAWLRMDSPANLMMIVGVWIFDRPIERAALVERLRERLLRHDRFRQKVVADSTGHWWVDDDGFSLDNHVTVRRLPSRGTEIQLRRLVGKLAGEPLNPDHPLWHFDLVDNFDGTSALIVRIHHCIADGIALVGVTLSIADDPPSGTGAAHDADGETEHGRSSRHREDRVSGTDAIFAPLTQAATRVAEAAGAALAASVAVAGDESARAALLRAGTRAATDALKIALMGDDSPTSLKGVPRGRKAVAWNDPLPLDEVKAVCRVLGVSVNDVLLSCVAGALQRYLEAVGDDTRGKEIRAMVPVNLRPPEATPTLGNRFGLVPLVLPVGISNPVERLYEVRRRMDELKGGYQGPLAFALVSAVGHAPRAVQKLLLDYLAHKGTAVMTNVPGPTRALRFLGRSISQAMFWVPQSGTIGLGVSIFSYDGGVQFGIIADTALCPDPQRIIDQFAPEFERLLLTLSLLPRELVQSGHIDGREVERRLFRAHPPARKRARRAPPAPPQPATKATLRPRRPVPSRA